ncbi:zinc finger protein 638 isoform X2 [Melopsittacus undulatus]|uniref:zinc finger protein 638 isoform X2 n=1 Tax=Melopsittacus undulatus TaxID=13146 RepID=UPI00146D8578|nr:zinc finger protein 638 isoform X2 [Melopsittacus undulatus]
MWSFKIAASRGGVSTALSGIPWFSFPSSEAPASTGSLLQEEAASVQQEGQGGGSQAHPKQSLCCRGSFVLFLESFAPLVNSLNLGIGSPLVLGPPPLQLAHIKTHLALQQLTSVAPNPSAPPYAWLNQAVPKSTMFSPRGTLPQRPRGPNPSGKKPLGSLRGGGAAGHPRKPNPGAPQGTGTPPRFSGQETIQWTGSQRINVRVTLHRADPRKVKEKSNLHQEQKAEPRSSRWENPPCPAGTTGQKAPVSEHTSNAQTRYTPESASSILASFGLSNEDLEELSRYPDDQLTPENMPRILREIRVRKMGPSIGGLHTQSRGEDAVGVKSKVIDYGHASKYGYMEEPLDVRAFNPEVLPEDPLEARVYNPEASTGESREDFPREQNVPQSAPMGIPPANVMCNPVFPVEDIMKLTGFQNDSSNPRSFFPAEATGKVPGMCTAPAGLPVVKPVSQPAIPPVMPPMMPPLMPPLAQPMMQPVMPPMVQQPMPQHVMPPMTQPPFSPELLAAITRHGRPQHDTGTSSSSAQSSSGVGQKPFQAQLEGPIKSPFGIVKASWLPVFPQSDSQKIKRLPTPSMMNDYYATSPRIFPHMCSLCNVECTHMKDWILHQNTPSHLESCRQLRQQYPDWNPESHSSKRNAGDRKENQTPRRRSSSSSPSPRRSRASSSSYVPRRSRSRSSGRFRSRPRSRSPRQMRRLSPRHRSRSPQRSRNPLRSSSRPQRSSSYDWAARRSARYQDRKAALEAVMKTLGPGFVAAFNKHKSLQAAGQGSSGSGKASSSQGVLGKVSGSLKKLLKAGVPSKASKDGAGSSSSSADADDLAQSEGMEEEEEGLPPGTSAPRPPSYNRLLREELLTCGTVLQISDLPDDGFSDQDIKKIVQPFGKVSDLIVLRSRNEAFLEMNYKEAVIAAVKYGETVPVLVNGKRVKISIAEKPRAPPGQAKKAIKKRTQIVKKAAPGTKKDPNATTKKLIAGKKEKTKKSALTGESKTKKTSNTAAKSVEEDVQIPVEAEMEAEETKLSEPKTEEDGDPEPGKAAAETQAKGATSPAALLDKLSQMPQVAAVDLNELNKALIDQEATIMTIKSEEPTDPGVQEMDDSCVVLISNLPEKGFSVEDVSNLAKPFGGLRDVLILSSHKKAYLEISRKCADSMVKFYTCFPMSLDGNQLCITMLPQYHSVKDEEALFTALIKDSDPQVDAESLHRQFVHLGNLPDAGYRELEVVCVGLRFGKVDHYVVLKNKNKAILQLDSPSSARSMYSFLRQYPYSMGEHTLTCTLSPRAEAAEAEAVKKEVKQEELSLGSSGLKIYPEGSGVVQRAAANPALEPSVAKEGAISHVKEEEAAGLIEPSESHPERAGRDLAVRLMEAPMEKVGTGVTAASIKPIGTEPPQVKLEEMSPPPPSPPAGGEEEEAAPGDTKAVMLEPAPKKEAQEKGEELSPPAAEPPELSRVGKAEDGPWGCAVSPAGGSSGVAVPKVMPPSLAPVQVVSSVATQPSDQWDAPEKKAGLDGGRIKAGVSVSLLTEKKPGPQAVEKQLDGAGAGRELQAEEPAPRAGRAMEENPRKLSVRTGAEPQKKVEQPMAKVGAVTVKAASAASEKSEGSLVESHPNTGAGASRADEAPKALALSSPAGGKECSSAAKTILRAVLSLPDIAKARVLPWRNEPLPCKGGEQKTPLKTESQSPMVEKKVTPKEGDAPQPDGSKPSLGDGSSTEASRSSVGDGEGGNGRNPSQQEESQVESRASAKQTQEGESRACSMKTDNSSTKVPADGDAKPSTSGTASSEKPKEEEELFPFNLDEFVTVDEVVEEVEPPVKARRKPARAKRKAGAKGTSAPSSKRRKGKRSMAPIAESELSFVTLDEIGEEEEGAGPLMAVATLEALGDPQGLVVVDEVMEEEELSEAVKDPQSLLTLDEISEQEDLGSHKDTTRLDFEEQDLKAEPLVTVDEIGEVEELPLNEPTGLSLEDVPREDEEVGAEDPRDGASPPVPDDPSALVTVDEIQEDNEDNPLVTVDEVNEDEDDFLADFNRLKEELNFVTVDEVGEEDEEEEDSFPGKTQDAGSADVVAVAGPEEKDVDVVAVAGPQEMESQGDTTAAKETTAVTKSTGHLGSAGEDLKSHGKNLPSSGVPKAQSAPTDLDYLVPKAGFFCQICSLFYAKETSVKNHCKTQLHRQNLEKFMAKQPGQEQRSWR